LTNVKITTLSFAIAAAVAITSPLPATPAHAQPVFPSGPATACAPGVPVRGDYNGDGSPDLEVTTRMAPDGRFFFSTQRTNLGAWVDISVENVQSADLNGDVCADLVGTSAGSTSLILGSPTGVDRSTLRTLSLPQAAPGTQLHTAAAALVTGGVHQVVVAGRVRSEPSDIWTSPFVDIVTLDATGAPADFQVLNESGVVADSTERDWPTAIAGEDGVVVIGYAGATVSGKANAGSIQVLTGTASEPARLHVLTTLSQSSPGVPNTSETGDRFGESLALRDGRLAVGVPAETTGRARHTGRVQLFRWNASTRSFTPKASIDQNTPGVRDSNESGDGFGATLTIARGLTAPGSYDAVIGTPREKLGAARHAGAVTVASFTKRSYRTITQSSPGVPGIPDKAPSEALTDGDVFGAAIGTLPTSASTDTLLIGAPGETNGRCLNQGYVVTTDGKQLRAHTRWTYLKPPTTECSLYDAETFLGWGSGFAVGSTPLAELP
jgi:hypothetical protein